MISVLSKFGIVTTILYSVAGFSTVNADNAQETNTLRALDNAKQAFIKKDYNQMWQEVDKITSWLETNSPRSGLEWVQAKQMIKDWVKKNWREDVIEVKALSDIICTSANAKKVIYDEIIDVKNFLVKNM